MHSAFMAVSILRFLFISTVAVRAAGGECILPHKICRTACLCHCVIQMTHCRREVVQSQFTHQRTDAALGKAPLIAASVGVFDKIHVPGIRVAVCGFQCCGGLHHRNIFFAELALTAHAAKPPHRNGHHRFGIIVRQALHLRPLRHGENERAEHSTAHYVQPKLIFPLELRQTNQFSSSWTRSVPRASRNMFT